MCFVAHGGHQRGEKDTRVPNKMEMERGDGFVVGGSHPGKETAGRGCNASQARLTANCPARLAFTDSQPRLASPDHSQIQCQLSPASSLAVHVSADYASHLRLTQ